MLLCFQAGDQRYALDTQCVVEIVPRVAVRPIAHAPACVAGVFRYRGGVVPVVDLTALLLERPSGTRMSTRIILVELPPDNGDTPRVVGLIAERVVDTLDAGPGAGVPPGVRVDEAPYLDDVVEDNGELVQLVRADRLLPPDVRRMLYAAVEEAS
jgi:chemotaxis-related protein WspB